MIKVKKRKRSLILKALPLQNRFILAVIFVAFLSSSLYPFGKNKVQYSYFQWDIIRTPHFDIYYNHGQKLLAEQTALILEDAAAELSQNLRFELNRILPVIIYNSHNDFEQSNVILEMIDEGTGGFTEVFKSRIVVPFTGDYGDYRHVLHHELTHGYEFNILLGGFWESLFIRPFMFMPPLWFMEGLAEQQSIGWDSEVDLILRDATVNNLLVPIQRLEDLWELRGGEYYMIYKQGQGFLHYISEKYGKYKCGEILKLFQKTRDFNNSFKFIIGKSHYEVFKDWVKSLRKNYWPLVRTKKDPGDFAKKLTDHLEDGSFYNLKPVWSPEGDKIAYLSDKNIFLGILLMDAVTGEEDDQLVESGRESDYEEMHSRENALSWSDDGRYLIFVSKSGKYDKINIYDFKEEEFLEPVNPRLDSISNPDISSDNKFIVFCGLKDGKEDLYLIRFNGTELTRLTDDMFAESYSIWDKSGEYIIFTSNRDKGYLSRDKDIYAYAVRTGKISRIIASPGNNISPQIDRSNNRMVYVSDRDGFQNIYIKKINGFTNINDLLNEKEYKITDIITGAFDPSFSPDGRKIVFSAYYKLGQDIYTMDVPKELQDDLLAQKSTNTIRVLNEIPESAYEKSEIQNSEYGFEVTPDMIMGGLLYSSLSGIGGFAYLSFSDILGDHRFSIATDFLSGDKNLNFQILYYYLKYRMNFGVGLFHYKEYYYYYSRDEEGYDFNLFYLNKYGVDLITSYPFSKFLRLECDFLSMRYIRNSIDEIEDEDFTTEDASMNVVGTSLVYDTTLWGMTAPVWGFRGDVTYQKSLHLTGHDWVYELGFIDMRKYFLLFKKYTFAFRGQYGSVWGRDRFENKFYIGGYNTIRGHRYSEYSGTRVFLFNMEYRFPLVNIIQIAWPFTFNIGNLRSVFFWDFGSAWDNTDKWRIGSKNGVYRFQDLKSGLGWGLRFGIYVLRFKLDFATPWDGSRIFPLSRWQGFFSMGYDF